MSNAKYYIYRNLHTGNFSVKHKGIVIARLSNIVAKCVEFKVSSKGRAKVLAEKKKYVHAYVVCSDYEACSQYYANAMKTGEEVYYNPYKHSSFVIATTHEKIVSCPLALLTNNKVYLH